MSDVFISYSRKNSDFARRLIDRLILQGQDAWVDWEGIPLTSPNWWTEIKTGIEAADSFVFIMSPDSMASVVCNMELDYAIELHKRIIPVVYQDVISHDAFASIADFEPDEAMEERLAGKDPLIIARDNWQRLSHINWLFFRESDNFDDASEILFRTVATDLEYVKEHTRFLTRALEWSRENQRGDLLLFGEDIDRAETWLEKAEIYASVEVSDKVDVVNPLPQDLHHDYITVSRKADRRRKRLAHSAQVSIGVLVVVLALGLLIGSSIVTQTQSQVAAANETLTQIPSTLTLAGQQIITQQSIADTAERDAQIANTQVAEANDALTAVPPTLTQVNNQVVLAQEQANFANTEVASANNALTAVPPTLTLVNDQVIIAQERADSANDALTAVPSTLTQVNDQARVAQEQANIASTQVADANNALTAVPPTLTEVSDAIRVAETERDIAATEVAVAESQAVQAQLQADNASTQVYVVGQTLTPIPVTLDAASTQQADAENTLAAIQEESYRYQLAGRASLLQNQNENDALAFAFEAVSAGQLPNDLSQVFYQVATNSYNHQTLSVPTGRVHSLAFSPDGKILAFAKGNRIIIWDVERETEIRTLTGHDYAVVSLAFNQDGTLLASGSLGEVVKLWDVDNGSEFSTLSRNSDFVQRFDIAFSPDGLILATVGDEKITLWDVNNGTASFVFDGPPWFADGIAFSPDGTILASGNVGGIELWTMSNLGQSTRLGYADDSYFNDDPDNLSFSDVAFSPDGSRIASASSDGTVRTWDIATGNRINVLSGHANAVSSIAFSPDGRILVSASDDRAIKLWDVNSGTELATLNGHTDAVIDIAFSPDGSWIASASTDGTVKIWNVNGIARVVHPSGDPIYLGDISFSANGAILAVSDCLAEESNEYCMAGTIKLWDANTLTERIILHTSAFFEHLAFSPDDNLLASAGCVSQRASRVDQSEECSGSKIKLWRISTSEEFDILGHFDQVNDLAFSPDGNLLASASCAQRDYEELCILGEIKLWDTHNNTELVTLTLHASEVSGLAFSPDGKTLASVGCSIGENQEYFGTLRYYCESEIKIWDIQAGNELNSLTDQDNLDFLFQHLVFSPDGFTVAAAELNVIKLWDIRDGTQYAAFLGHTDDIRGIQFSPDGRMLVSTSKEGIIKLWDLNSRTEVTTLTGHPDWVNDLAFSPDGSMLASTGLDGTLRIWNVGIFSEFRQWVQENRFIRELTCDERQRFNSSVQCNEDGTFPTRTPLPTPFPIPVPSWTPLWTPLPAYTISSVPTLDFVPGYLSTKIPFQHDDQPIALDKVIEGASNYYTTIGFDWSELFPGSNEYWLFDGIAGQRLEITTEADWDTVLILYNPDGDQIALNDDDNELPNLNSRINIDLPETGQYVIKVQGYDDSSGGYYRLESRSVGNDTILGTNEGQIITPYFQEYWLYEGQAGERLTIKTVAEWDTVITLYDPNGNQIGYNDDDDQLPNLNSRINMPLPETGQYTIEVRSIDERGGPYKLEIQSASVDNLETYATAGTNEGRITLGWSQRWPYNGQADERLTIKTVAEWDTVITLYDPNGNQIGYNDDDDQLPNLNSRINMPLPETGQYIIEIRGFDDTEGGPYSLLIESSLSVELTPTSQSMTYYIQGDRRVNARSCPGTSCGVVIVLSPGDNISVIETVSGDLIAGSADWHRTFIDGTEAFVHSSLVGPDRTSL